ncbi:MAG TPA: ABC transporter ATP-binding protein [Candidatus Sulfotelmatobacter sp.]|nr:ABC transporter ATP-binding protein [Candidatus Sulfotelmatobacter sp.]
MSALVEIIDLAKAYRGIHAVDGVSFAVQGGSITGLIGPNGSGKSTTIDCISGFQRLDAGRVMLDGRDITGLRPQAIARAGLVRTFQTVRVYDHFSVIDNLLTVAEPFGQLAWFDVLLRTPKYRAIRRAAEERALTLIDLVGLARLADMPATILSYGQKKLLALAAALMSNPKLVVLDEPVAGVNPTRINEVADILRRANEAGATFLIVEHNVEFISALCHHVIVFDQGRKLVEGPPAAVHGDPRVLDAYLGVGDVAPVHLPEAS